MGTREKLNFQLVYPMKKLPPFCFIYASNKISLKLTFPGKMGTEWKYKIINDNQSRSQVKLDATLNTSYLLP